MVSGKLSLDPGSYVVIGKLYLAFQSGLLPFEVLCELRQGDEVLDFAGAVLTLGGENPMTLVSTTTVQVQPREFTIACQSQSAGDAAAVGVQLVGISVDEVSGP